MTIDALAAASGVSRGTVIQIETARGNPSIGTLCNLAAALRVGVASLVDGDAAPRVVVRRGAEAAELWTSAAGSSAVFRIGTDPPDVVELWDWTLRPGDGFDGEAHPIGTQEVLLVLTGQWPCGWGPPTPALDTGDTVLFQAHARTATPASAMSRCASSWWCSSPATRASSPRRRSPRPTHPAPNGESSVPVTVSLHFGYGESPILDTVSSGIRSHDQAGPGPPPRPPG